MTKTKCLEEMTWPQFSDAAKNCDTILIPVGSVEQEGLHLPMATDSIVALEVAKRVSQVSDILVAPLINVGYSNWHSTFPGTLSLSMETLIQVLREICMNLVQNGMRRFLFINPHIGNEEPIYSIGTELRKDGLGIAGMINPWKLSNEMGNDMDGLKENKFKHAGEIMTSVMLALRPDLVDMPAAKKGFLNSENASIKMETSRRCKFQGYHVEIFRMSKELTDTGAMGDPSEATKSKGEEMISRWVEYISNFIDEFKKIPLSA
jgi:creatinine amidohydrolase